MYIPNFVQADERRRNKRSATNNASEQARKADAVRAVEAEKWQMQIASSLFLSLLRLQNQNLLIIWPTFLPTEAFLLSQAINQSRLSQDVTKFIMIRILLIILPPKFEHEETSVIRGWQGYSVGEKEVCKLGWLYSNRYREARIGILQNVITHREASVLWSRSF